MKTDMTQSAAQELAVAALGFIAKNQVLLDRFLSLSGIQAQDIRQAAQTAEFFANILAFLLGNEADLLDFCQEENTIPEMIVQAFALLPGGHVIERAW